MSSRGQDEAPAERPAAIALPPLWLGWRWALGSGLLVLGLLLGLTGGTLLEAGQVLSSPHGDARLLFAPWREYGFAELAAGRFPHWNPHIYLGVPCHGGMQTALLYPLNLGYLLLPLRHALNADPLLHLLLTGAGVWLWAAVRGLGGAGRLLAALVGVFGGAVFMQLTAGHLPHLATVAWSPLVLAGVEGFARRGGRGWLWLLVGASTMQVLAGFPQLVFYTAILAQLQALSLIDARPGWRQRALIVTAPALGYLAAGGLAAAQLLPGLQAAGESVRASGADRAFAASFAFTPEALLTLVFGDLFGVRLGDYWGAWLPWDGTAFVGAAAASLALVGLLRAGWREALLLLACVLLALGDHVSGLYQALADHLPLYGRFRATGRFMLLVQLRLAVLAGQGLCALLAAPPADAEATEQASSARPGPLAIALSLALALPCLLLVTAPALAEALARALSERGAAPQQLAARAEWVALACGKAGLAWLALGGLLFALRRGGAAWRPRVAVALVALVAIELLGFAAARVARFPLADAAIAPPLLGALEREPEVGRVLFDQPLHSCAATFARRDAVWGYGPDVSARLRRLVGRIEGRAEAGSEYLRLRRPHPAWRMLRITHRLGRDADGVAVVSAGEQRLRRARQRPLPLAWAVPRWREAAGATEACRLAASRSFRPRELAVVERPLPEPPADPGAASVRVTPLPGGELQLEIDLTAPQLIVASLAYREGWVAVDSAGAHQPLMPVNGALAGIYLPAGHHRLTLAYRPASWPWGLLVSALSGIALLALALATRRRS